MSNSIQTSSQFHGKYDAIIDGQAIPCHNLSTARALVKRGSTVNSTPKEFEDFLRIECKGFCSPSGQYYAVVRVNRSPYIDTDVRIDCHNETTLRTLIRDGVSIGDLNRASEDQNNVRSQGGWNG